MAGRISLIQVFALVLMGLVGSGCWGGPTEPIDYGRDACASCKMVISDPRFGAELVSAKGKIHKFDSIECLGDFLQKDPQQGSLIYLSHSSQKGALIPSEKAIFVIDPGLRSPMGKGILVAREGETFAGSKPDRGGQTLRWPEILKIVREERDHQHSPK